MTEEGLKAVLMYQTVSTRELVRKNVTFADHEEIQEFMNDLAETTAKHQQIMYTTINKSLQRIKIIDSRCNGLSYDLIQLVGVWVND